MSQRYDWWDVKRGSHVIAEKNGTRWEYFEKESVRWEPMTPTRADRSTLSSFIRKHRKVSSTTNVE